MHSVLWKQKSSDDWCVPLSTVPVSPLSHCKCLYVASVSTVTWFQNLNSCVRLKRRGRETEKLETSFGGGSSRMKADRSWPSCSLTHVSFRASERCTEVQALPTSHLHLFTSSTPHRWSVLPWPGCSSHSVVLLHLTGRGLHREGFDFTPLASIKYCPLIPALQRHLQGVRENMSRVEIFTHNGRKSWWDEFTLPVCLKDTWITVS